ncbi:DNA cross-link repair protein [Raphidocelis subcapitata]|uniref:DNA cross-link repair protein n=1 Tax=Raphidocelis subcapitata TaxID=307507 RepID=A0A2V0PNQ8_9CHLO|nr:DNA cross-link repair protein [Raphidocelis subcapitata]|eukprot:GBF99590.1 DNA cross-link repair protein [Raphidocelis subcapitata]
MASQVAAIKRIPGTPFMVDGFRFAPDPAEAPHVVHFLTHYHGDHYTGLRRGFAGTIYTGEVTADLLVRDYGLRTGPGACRLERLALNAPATICGVRVTAVDANHCPGAVMLLFEVPRPGGGTHNILHTGDCRWQDWIKDGSVLATTRIDTLFLDTTYCLPRWTFPPQSDAVAAMAAAAREELAREPSTLLVCSAYHVGKERAFFGIALALGLKVWCSPAKMRTLHALRLPEAWTALLTPDPLEAGLHVLGGGLRPERLIARYGLPPPPTTAATAGAAASGDGGGDSDGDGDGDGDGRGGRGGRGGGGGGDAAGDEEGEDAPPPPGVAGRWKAVVGFRPTGWAYRRKPGPLPCWRLGAAALYSAPYSEHSSFSDLQACVRALRPRRIVPTVNAPDAAAAAAIVERFVGCGMDLSRDRRRLDAYFSKLAAPSGGGGGTDRGGCGDGGSGGDGVVERGTGGGDGGGQRGGGGTSSCAAAPLPAMAPEATQQQQLQQQQRQQQQQQQQQLQQRGCDTAPQVQPPAAASAAVDSEPFSIDSVDAGQQAAMLLEFERQQRLRRSVEAVKAARAAKKQRRGSSSGGGGGGGGRQSSQPPLSHSLWPPPSSK